jgi:hypothetical protein
MIAADGSLRASHADRDLLVEELRSATIEGRLELDEFEERVALTLRARTYGELAAIVEDLPAEPPVPTRAPAPARPATPARGRPDRIAAAPLPAPARDGELEVLRGCESRALRAGLLGVHAAISLAAAAYVVVMAAEHLAGVATLVQAAGVCATAVGVLVLTLIGIAPLAAISERPDELPPRATT